MNKRIITIILILLLFIGFCSFDFCRKSDKAVLKVIAPDIIQVDLNANKVFDVNETICIPNIETFTSDISVSKNNLAQKYNLSIEDALKLGYLTDEFSDNTLSNKRVKLKFSNIKNQNCQFADIIVDNQSYREKLLNAGLAISGNKPGEAFFKQLETARKLKLAVLNHKSNKFHKLDCKYGLIAHDAIVLPEKHIPKDAKPCKFCHIDKKLIKSNKPPQTYPLVISSGSIKMYLTDLTTKLKPDNKCSSLACKEILNQINQASSLIDIATYGWDNVAEINNALLKAKSRGVKIRLVYNSSTNQYYPELKTLIDISDELSTDTPKILMHNKFMVFDKKRVITGSMNFAKTGFSGFNTNCVFYINSSEIAAIFEEEFQQMLSGKFHTYKSTVKHKTVSLNETKITPLFSPKDKIITNKIIPLINSAKKYIYIPAFIITHEELSTALINAKNRSVDVKIIVDATSTASSRSKVKTLRSANIPLKVENYAGKVHSKTILIDDKFIISGSMNFSKSGENKNDENCLIIEDERLTKYYRGFFEYLWSKIPDKYLKQNVSAEGKNSIGSCSDGIDNDYDGKIDMADEGCFN